MFALAALASATALGTWWIHTFLGHRVVLNPMLRADYQPFARATMEVCWHITTLFLGIITGMLMVATVHPDPAVSRLFLAISLIFSLPSALMFPVIAKRRFGRWLAMPQFFLLGSIALCTTSGLVWPIQVSTAAGLSVCLGSMLLVLAVLHLAWAQGSSWPSKSRAELGALVVGQTSEKPFPGKGLTLVVTLFLGLAGVTLITGALMDWPAQPYLGFTWFLAVIFIARGFLGYFDPVLRPWTKSMPFKHWNQVLYSPISLLMGLLALGLALGGS